MKDRLTGEKIPTTHEELYQSSKNKEVIDEIAEFLKGKTYQESVEILVLVRYIVETKLTLK